MLTGTTKKLHTPHTTHCTNFPENTYSAKRFENVVVKAELLLELHQRNTGHKSFISGPFLRNKCSEPHFVGDTLAGQQQQQTHKTIKQLKNNKTTQKLTHTKQTHKTTKQQNNTQNKHKNTNNNYSTTNNKQSQYNITQNKQQHTNN
jgi:hypothetical protein